MRFSTTKSLVKFARQTGPKEKTPWWRAPRVWQPIWWATDPRRIAKEKAETARLAKIETDRLAEKAEAERKAAEAPDLEKISVFAQKILLLVEEAKNIKLSTKSADDILNAMVKNLNIAAEKGINNER